MSDLEARVKALEDQWQRLTQVFLAPPEAGGKGAQATSSNGCHNPSQPPNPPLPEHLAELVTFSEGKVTPKEYIHNAVDWQTINSMLKDVGYKWVSAGKDSHWEVL